MKGNQYFFSGCMLMVTFMAHAIDKDKHVLVAERSITAFNQCLEYLNKNEHKLSMFEGGTIAEYTKLEDVTPIVERATNWHFYDVFHDTDKALKSPFFFMNPSLHDIFNNRVKALDYVDSKDANIEIDYDAYLNETKEQISGRIIHYIQDMGVPAHVAPIYHSKPHEPWQECCVDIEPAPFDELFTEKNIDAVSELKIDKATCIDLNRKNNNSMTLLNVLDDIAKETRGRIQNKIVPNLPEFNNKTWEEVFWPIRRGNNNYASDKYAHPKKGNLGFLKFHAHTFSLPNIDGDKKGNAYWDFFERQYTLIRDNTVLALMIIYLK